MASSKGATHRRSHALALSLLGAIAACANGCGGSAEPAPTPALRVDVMYPGPLGDRSYADSVYAGLVRAGADTDVEVVSAIPVDAAAASAVLAGWTGGTADGRELIVVVGGDRQAAVDAMGCHLGGRYLVLLDGNPHPCSGMLGVVFDVYPASFLAGVAAVSASSTGRAAVVAGRDDPVVARFVRGFVAGVAHAGGTVTAVEYLADDVTGFNDLARAQAVAERLFGDADVVFPVAGASGLGVIAAARVADGRYVMGVDVDQSWLAPGAVVASVVKNLDGAVVDAIHDVVAGAFAAPAAAGRPRVQPSRLAVNPIFADRVSVAVAQAAGAAAAAGVEDLRMNPW